MKVYLGEEGLSQSWQADFPKTVECHKCKGNCRIMFVGIEGTERDGEKENYVCELHENTDGKYWPHDAIACAVYLCEKCFEPNTLLNQG